MADIGKELPHHLLNRLNRRGGIMSGELEPLRQHPVGGTKLLRQMGYENNAILRIVRHSHEYFTDSGYPDGLAAEDIPLGSRIVAVADAYDALTSWRPYRDRWERQSALDETWRGVERGLYDPKVVDLLIGLVA